MGFVVCIGKEQQGVGSRRKVPDVAQLGSWATYARIWKNRANLEKSASNGLLWLNKLLQAVTSIVTLSVERLWCFVEESN